MVDWTNPAAGDYWHDLQRMPLIRDGVSGHWTDLGEPERYDPKASYYGFPELGLHEHRDVANAYNFRWAESIARGYERKRREATAVHALALGHIGHPALRGGDVVGGHRLAAGAACGPYERADADVVLGG